MTLVDFFFTCVGIIILIGIFIGLFRIASGKYFSYYGGIGGTFFAYLINLLEFCFLAWFAGWALRKMGITLISIDWQLGVILGPIYTTYCWVFKKENKGISIFRNEN